MLFRKINNVVMPDECVSFYYTKQYCRNKVMNYF